MIVQEQEEEEIEREEGRVAFFKDIINSLNAPVFNNTLQASGTK